jgi:hypothetical protein
LSSSEDNARAATVAQQIQAAEAKAARQIQVVGAKNRQADNALNTESRDGANRSWIAKAIIAVFVGAIAIILFLLTLQGYTTGQWSLAASSASDLIRTAVLPIVTLILGFYFGQSGKG